MAGDTSSIWLFVEYGKGKTWGRAFFPKTIQTVKDLVYYLARGGNVSVYGLEMPTGTRMSSRMAGKNTVIASYAGLVEGE